MTEVTAFYYRDEKPNMREFFEPFAEEIEKLQSDGFVFQNKVFKVTISCVILDLPARANFQYITQFNGYHACAHCLRKGEYVANAVKYTWNDECNNIRTHEQFLLALKDISEKKVSSKYGITGISPAISFEHFDMVKSFGLDYMHCICLGVTKAMHKFWVSSPNNTHGSYITPAWQEILNKRILSIKPCTFISRLPKSLEYIAKFKASEFRSLLLFYSPFVLHGILEKKYLNHFILLSSSIYKLLSTNISNYDIAMVENTLIQFVKEFEELYGKENTTMNVHLLTHVVYCVKNIGPLWTQSMFSFESNNATLSRYVKSTDVLSELKMKYIVNKSILGNVSLFSKKKKQIKT